MKKIGLTGNIGSGKSTVSKIFMILGIPFYNADEEAKKILNKPEIIKKIISFAGTNILTNTAMIDRKKLAAIVFENPEKLHQLNQLIHPAVLSDFNAWVNKMNGPYIIMESAILFESNFNTLFDKIITVTANEETRINRVMNRDNVNREQVLIRMKHQIPEKEKIEKSDFIIVNNNEDLIIPQVIEIHQKLLARID